MHAKSRRTFLVAQTVKRLSTMRETWVRSLGREDSLEQEMATHSSTLAWKIQWMEELGARYCPWGRKESGTTERLHFHFQVMSVVSDSLQPYGLVPARLLCPGDSLGKNTGVGCHALLQGIFPIQGLKPCLLCLLHWQVGFYH